jgi:hypothetical protein
LEIIENLLKHYPELKLELTEIIEREIDFQTPAFVSRAKKMLARLKAIK